MMQLKQGEGLLLNIPILDRANQPVDLTSATKIRVAFIVRKLSIQKYQEQNLEPHISNYGELTVNSVNPSSIDVIITRGHSALFPVGDLSCAILVEFPDLVLTTKVVEYEATLGTISQGVLKEEDLTL
jgi:hypothetical protein